MGGNDSKFISPSEREHLLALAQKTGFAESQLPKLFEEIEPQCQGQALSSKGSGPSAQDLWNMEPFRNSDLEISNVQCEPEGEKEFICSYKFSVGSIGPQTRVAKYRMLGDKWVQISRIK